MMIILISVIGGVGFFTYKQVERTIETQMGNNAMDLAVTVAAMDIIQETLATTKDYKIIQNTIESFKHKTRFQYIIVMDMEGIKYSYPIEYDLGKKYISGGEERVLTNGEAYVSKDKNVLISAIRAFVPVYYQGRQVGAVLVGLLNNKVYEEIGTHIFYIEITLVIGLLIGVISAAVLSFMIKRTIFGLEPKEIALLLGQRDNILQSLQNGILAMDEKGNVILFNKTAEEIFDFKIDDIGKKELNIHSNYTNSIREVLESKQSEYNQEIKISYGKTLLCSHTLLRNHKDDIIGVVSSFQDLTEVKQMAEELTGIKRITSALRAQNHEFMNKLHTISGLIQLEEYGKAIKYISDVSNQRQEILEILNYKIKDAHIAGILLAKYNKASEAKIDLVIDSTSNITELPESITVDEICSVIGNLIENAIDELVKYENGKIVVKLISDEIGLKITIEDNGPGIREEIQKEIFNKGFTTKEQSRGYGLNIVKRIIDNAGGSIKLTVVNGTTWDIFIPLEGGDDIDTGVDCRR